MRTRKKINDLKTSEGKSYFFISIPKYWNSGIKLSLDEHNQSLDKKLKTNKFLKTIFTETAKNKDNPFLSNFDFSKHVEPFLKSKNKWSSIYFKKNEAEIVFKWIDDIEKKTKKQIQLNHYLLACIWNAMPFLEDLYESK